MIYNFVLKTQYKKMGAFSENWWNKSVCFTKSVYILAL